MRRRGLISRLHGQGCAPAAGCRLPPCPDINGGSLPFITSNQASSVFKASNGLHSYILTLSCLPLPLLEPK